MGEVSVRISNLCKNYFIYNNERERLKNFLLPGRSKTGTEFQALKNINADFYSGEAIGLVGLNGSGKSTLSRIIAGITFPSTGSVEVRGEVSMLSTTSGLNQMLTGRENIYYKCLLMGFTYQQIKSIEESIVDFADIGIYIDQPLNNYSSGMRARIGFAISVHIHPDVLIVDEALSVGDQSFADKCTERMNQIMQEGKTIVFVSHSSKQVEEFCDKVMWLHQGEMVGFGTTEEILPAYVGFASEYSKMSKKKKQTVFPDLAACQKKYCLKVDDKNNG